MGTALAKALLANRQRVTVWNRTTSKCAALGQAGANIARSVRDAIDASDVVIVCVLDYSASDSLLRIPEVAPRLKGKTMIQLTTGTPLNAQDAAAWAERHGVAYLDGTIAGYPKDMGTPEGTILYAGSRSVFDAVRPILTSLGGHAVFVGEVIGSASVLDGAVIGAFSLGAMLAFLYGAALSDAEGISLDTYLSIASARGIPSIDSLQASVRMIKNRHYAGSQASLDVWAAAARHFVEYVGQSGLDSSYPQGLLDRLEQAIAMGHGQDELPAVFECFRKHPRRANE